MGKFEKETDAMAYAMGMNIGEYVENLAVDLDHELIAAGLRGYLAGKEAICYPGFEKELAGATISKKRVVRDGKVITAAGMGVAMEFGLEILAALRGKTVADRVQKAILAD